MCVIVFNDTYHIYASLKIITYIIISIIISVLSSITKNYVVIFTVLYSPCTYFIHSVIRNTRMLFPWGRKNRKSSIRLEFFVRNTGGAAVARNRFTSDSIKSTRDTRHREGIHSTFVSWSPGVPSTLHLSLSLFHSLFLSSGLASLCQDKISNLPWYETREGASFALPFRSLVRSFSRSSKERRAIQHITWCARLSEPLARSHRILFVLDNYFPPWGGRPTGRNQAEDSHATVRDRGIRSRRRGQKRPEVVGAPSSSLSCSLARSHALYLSRHRRPSERQERGRIERDESGRVSIRRLV